MNEWFATPQLDGTLEYMLVDNNDINVTLNQGQVDALLHLLAAIDERLNDTAP